MKITRVTANTSTRPTASSAYTAPVVMPSCARISAIEVSIRSARKKRRCHHAQRLAEQDAETLLHELPLAFHDFHHDARALVEAHVIGLAHVHDTVRGDQVRGVLQCIAQRAAELLGAGLGGLESDWHGVLEQQVDVPG